MTAACALRADRLVCGYRRRRQRHAVAGPIDAAVRAGEMVCLVGPNGTGKSTLLRTLSGMQPPLGGRVLVGDAPLDSLAPMELARRVALVSADRVEVSLLRAVDVVSLGRYPYTGWGGALDPEDHAIVRAAMEQTSVTDLADRDMTTLSDGERQRVMIARALAQRPRVIVLDEPTAHLDVNRRVELVSLLRSLSRRTGTSVVLSTHDLELALPAADGLWLLDGSGDITTGTVREVAASGALAAAFGPSVRWEGERVVVRAPVGEEAEVRPHATPFAPA